MENKKIIRTQTFNASAEEKAYIISVTQRLITIISSQQNPPNLNPENDEILGYGWCAWPKGKNSDGHMTLPRSKRFNSLKDLPEVNALLSRPFEDKNSTWSVGTLHITSGKPHMDYEHDIFIRELGLKLMKIEPYSRVSAPPDAHVAETYNPRNFHYETTNLINNTEVIVSDTDESERPTKNFPSNFFAVKVELKAKQ